MAGRPGRARVPMDDGERDVVAGERPGRPLRDLHVAPTGASSTARVFSVACSTGCCPSRRWRRSGRPRVMRPRRATRARRRHRCRRRGSEGRAPSAAPRVLSVPAGSRANPMSFEETSRLTRNMSSGVTVAVVHQHLDREPVDQRADLDPRARRRRSPPGTRPSPVRGARCRRSNAASADSGPRAPSPSPDRGAPAPRSPPRAPTRPGTRTRGAGPGPRARSSRSSCARADGFLRSSRDSRR